MIVDAIERGNALEAALMARIGEIYADALSAAVKKRRAFLRKIEALNEGRIKPPKYYVDTDQVDKWREGFVRELMRQEEVIEGIMQEINRAGEKAAVVIQDVMPEYYSINEQETIERLGAGMQKAGSDGKLMRHTKEQIKVILQQEESPFSKLAYMNLGRNTAVRRRLQNELAQATVLGEDQRQIIKRIRAVTGQAEWQARRVAQTERTRVQSQARWNQGKDAAAMGVRVYNEWSARMVNTRDTHAALDGVVAKQGEYFPGSPLRYPGDPTAPASEVINCHCVLIPGVLLGGQDVKDGKVVKQDAPVAVQEPVAEFVPAKTKQEAEEYAKRFAQNVSYAGVSLKNANVINEELTKLTKKYPINKLSEIASGSRGIMSANYKLLKISTNKLGKALDDDYKNFITSQENTRAAIKTLNDRWAGKKMPPDVVKTVQKLEKTLRHKRWGVMDSYENKVAVTVAHEYGHIVSDQYFGMINGDLANPNMKTNWSIRNVSSTWRNLYNKAIENGDVYRISNYGNTNDREFFAECFAAREYGEKLPDYIEHFMSEVLKNGIL